MIKRILLSSAIGFGLYNIAPTNAHAGANPLLGEVILVGYNFCPRGYSAADGSLLPINSYQALYSLYGTTYGGDGRTSFALPDMRGRAPIHVGKGPGLSDIKLGQRGGSEDENPKTSGLTGVDAEDGERVASAQRPIKNRSPYLGLRYCVATQGIFPSRN